MNLVLRDYEVFRTLKEEERHLVAASGLCSRDYSHQLLKRMGLNHKLQSILGSIQRQSMKSSTDGGAAEKCHFVISFYFSKVHHYGLESSEVPSKILDWSHIGGHEHQKMDNL